VKEECEEEEKIEEKAIWSSEISVQSGEEKLF
jgi:hypothetical protein